MVRVAGDTILEKKKTVFSLTQFFTENTVSEILNFSKTPPDGHCSRYVTCYSHRCVLYVSGGSQAAPQPYAKHKQSGEEETNKKTEFAGDKT